MPDDYRFDWDPFDWQKFVLQLVRQCHGHDNYQRVPDVVNGDSGIEAYTLDGCLYQCYAPAFPATISDLTKKIKSKIVSDIPKLVTYKDKLSKLLGDTIAKRWILVVPRFDDKSVLTTCHSEAKKIRTANLPFVASDFTALVKDQTDFASEIEALRRNNCIKPTLPYKPVSDDDVASWQVQNGDFLDNLKSKIRRGFPNLNDDDRNKKVTEYIKWQLDRANILEQIRAETPDLWDRLVTTTATAERILETLGVDDGSPRNILKSQIEELRTSIHECLGASFNADVQKIAFGTISDWLMRCPLDFPEQAP